MNETSYKLVGEQAGSIIKFHVALIKIFFQLNNYDFHCVPGFPISRKI